MNIKILFFIILTSTCFADFNRGTLNEYKIEQLKYQQQRGWTPLEIEEGKIGKSSEGVDKPDKCRTMKEFSCMQNIDGSNDYVWKKYTENDLPVLNEEQYNAIILDWLGE